VVVLSFLGGLLLLILSALSDVLPHLPELLTGGLALLLWFLETLLQESFSLVGRQLR